MRQVEATKEASTPARYPMDEEEQMAIDLEAIRAHQNVDFEISADEYLLWQTVEAQYTWLLYGERFGIEPVPYMENGVSRAKTSGRVLDRLMKAVLRWKSRPWRG